MFVALSQFFTGVATHQPVLLTVEDVHWSDDTSLEFLLTLARRCAVFPLLLLVTYRNDEQHPGLHAWLAHLDRERLAHEFVAAPLSRGEVEAMLGAIFDRPSPMPTPFLAGAGSALHAVPATRQVSMMSWSVGCATDSLDIAVSCTTDIKLCRFAAKRVRHAHVSYDGAPITMAPACTAACTERARHAARTPPSHTNRVPAVAV